MAVGLSAALQSVPAVYLPVSTSVQHYVFQCSLLTDEASLPQCTFFFFMRVLAILGLLFNSVNFE